MYAHYQALIFDCDGTLVDSLYAHESAWIEILGAYSIPYTVERMHQLGGVPTDKTIAILADEAHMEVNVAAIAKAKDERFGEIMFDSIREVKPIVDIARQYHRKLALGVATGSHTDMARLMLRTLRIDHLFDVIVGADQVTRHKPDPDVFLKAARQLGVAPAKCCAFDDAHGGILAARRAGMDVVDVRNIWTPGDRLFSG
jgi:beta-phosphoglucomutase family hydrolase